MESFISYEYLAILLISDPVFSELRKFKCEYNSDSAVKSKPHITLCNFIHPSSVEKRIINSYSRLASNISPLKIQLCGFGCFSTHTIYVKLKNEKEVQEIGKHVTTFTNAALKKIPDYPPHYMSKPHITVAKGILESDFSKVWPAWENKEYYAEFDANCIRLLRRPFSNLWLNYEVISDFTLTGDGLIETQLKLF